MSTNEQVQQITGKQVATIAALLLTAPKPGDLAGALLGLLPPALLARFPKLGAQACLSAASLALSVADLPIPQPGRSRTNVGRTGQTLGIISENDARGESIYTAMYAINAAQRLFRGREDFQAALDTERGYLRLHRQAKERRARANNLVACHGGQIRPRAWLATW